MTVAKSIFKSIFKGYGHGFAGGEGSGPDQANLLAWYRTTIDDGKLIAYAPPSSHITQQVKSSGFFGAGSATVTGLLTTDTITATGDAPTCSVAGTLTFPGPDCWDIWVHRDGVLWAYWPGINVGGTVESDQSGNGHNLKALVGTTITERLDGSGTSFSNEQSDSILFKLPPDANGRVSALFVGDSITVGAYASADLALCPDLGAAGQIRNAMQARLGNGGEGYIGLWRPEWVKTGVWAASTDWGPFGNCWLAENDVAKKFTLSGIIGDNIDIFYLASAGVGTATCSIDGGAAIDLIPVAGSNVTRRWSLSLGDVGEHTVVISAPASGKLYLSGAAVYIGNNGAVVHNLGNSGKYSYDFYLRVSDRFSMTLFLAPKVVFIGVLANDYTGQQTLAIYNTRLTAVASTFAGWGADICLWAPPDPNLAPLTIPISSYENELNSIAVAGGYRFISIRTLWGSYAENISRMHDTQHPNLAGHIEIAANFLTATGSHAKAGIDGQFDGATFPVGNFQAPLGAEFQIIPEFTNNASVDLATLVPTAKIRIGDRGMVVYSADLDAAGIARADRVVGA